MYHTIRTILQYDTIYMIRILYHTIHEHLQYADTIQNFLHMIRRILTTIGGARGGHLPP